MVYTFMIRFMNISVVVVVIFHVIVLAHHLAIRRDLILISVIIKELLQEIIAFPLITIHIMLINVQILLEMMVQYQQDISINHHQHQQHVKNHVAINLLKLMIQKQLALLNNIVRVNQYINMYKVQKIIHIVLNLVMVKNQQVILQIIIVYQI